MSKLTAAIFHFGLAMFLTVSFLVVTPTQPTASAINQPPQQPCQTMELIGHRGTASGVARNNSLQAFQKAAASGAEVIELDIHRTKSTKKHPGVWIVYHDSSIKGHKISKTTYSTLKKIQPDLVTYTQAVAYIAKTGKRIQVEVKPSASKATFKSMARIAKQYNMMGKFELASFRTSNLTKAKKYGFRTLLLTSKPVSAATVKKYARSIGINQSIASAARIRSYKAAGIKVYVYTVNSTASWNKFASYGANGVYTDYSGAYTNWCNNLSKPKPTPPPPVTPPTPPTPPPTPPSVPPAPVTPPPPVVPPPSPA